MIEIVKSNTFIDGKRMLPVLRDSLAELYGEHGLSLADIHPIEYGDSYVIVSCDHRMLQQVRSAVAYISRIDGAEVLLQVSIVSGTLRRLRAKMEGHNVYLSRKYPN
ncbi:MAG: Rpp14/Pop5 family protein [Nitrososphaerota archaeon]|nr:Rpp14/Pop5 family protein [Candidatus Bathyarchaeota archaeon]MCX8162200.1 Rpp14/Pop5 family protein [Candidatus Bathyarchaeota archaeon]MDW8062233.1 Rpp14/Pop5 family protein [Nitrososphaerota archaeon]